MSKFIKNPYIVQLLAAFVFLFAGGAIQSLPWLSYSGWNFTLAAFESTTYSDISFSGLILTLSGAGVLSTLLSIKMPRIFGALTACVSIGLLFVVLYGSMETTSKLGENAYHMHAAFYFTVFCGLLGLFAGLSALFFRRLR